MPTSKIEFIMWLKSMYQAMSEETPIDTTGMSSEEAAEAKQIAMRKRAFAERAIGYLDEILNDISLTSQSCS